MYYALFIIMFYLRGWFFAIIIFNQNQKLFLSLRTTSFLRMYKPVYVITWGRVYTDYPIPRLPTIQSIPKSLNQAPPYFERAKHYFTSHFGRNAITIFVSWQHWEFPEICSRKPEKILRNIFGLWLHPKSHKLSYYELWNTQHISASVWCAETPCLHLVLIT